MTLVKAGNSIYFTRITLHLEGYKYKLNQLKGNAYYVRCYKEITIKTNYK